MLQDVNLIKAKQFKFIHQIEAEAEKELIKPTQLAKRL